MLIAATLITILITAVLCIAAYGYMQARKLIVAAALLASVGLTWATWGVAAGWRPLASTPDPEIALRSSQWQCMASHSVQSTALIPMGKMMIPVASTRQDCDRYERH